MCSVKKLCLLDFSAAKSGHVTLANEIEAELLGRMSGKGLLKEAIAAGVYFAFCPSSSSLQQGNIRIGWVQINPCCNTRDKKDEVTYEECLRRKKEPEPLMAS